MSSQKRCKLLLATANAHKVQEMKAILADYPLDTVSLADMGLTVPPPEESGGSYLENALIKARYYAQATGLPCLADDSGLEIKALNGAPGLYSHRFLNECRTQAEKNACVLQLLREEKDRYAQFRCVCVIYGLKQLGLDGAGDYLTGEAFCPGEIAEKACGSSGFGYDPIFLLPRRGRCMAELAEGEKNAVSHRGQAVRMTADKLLEMLNAIE